MHKPNNERWITVCQPEDNNLLNKLDANFAIFKTCVELLHLTEKSSNPAGIVSVKINDSNYIVTKIRLTGFELELCIGMDITLFKPVLVEDILFYQAMPLINYATCSDALKT